MIELRILRHLVALAEYGSYKKAAKAVHLSQPALTKSVQHAERHYRVPLFDRKSRPVTPTPQGQVVIQRARAILSATDAIPGDLAALSDCAVGQLTLGAGPVIAEAFVPQVLGRLVKKYPGLTVRVRVGDWIELQRAILRDEIELFIAGIDDLADEPAFQAIPVITEPMLWFSRPGHPLSHRRRVRPADLLAYPLVLPSMPVWQKGWLEEVQRQASRTATVHIVDDCSIVKQIVRSTDGVGAATPSILADDLRLRRFVQLAVQGQPALIHTGIVHIKNRTLTPAAKAFIVEVQMLAHPRSVTQNEGKLGGVGSGD